MLKWALLQQSDLLHELALAYYDRHAVKDSNLSKNTQAAYQQADKAGKYKSVLRFFGQHVPHPAMASEKEYFAELMESYFLVNDHYPFVRCELRDQDPTGHELIAILWEGKVKREGLVHASLSGKLAIRQGDWVLIAASSGQDNNKASGEPAWFRMERGYAEHKLPFELYNLREDPTQKTNRFAEQIDRAKAMHAVLERFQSEGRSVPRRVMDK